MFFPLPAIDSFLNTTEAKIARWSKPRFLAFATCLSLLLVIFFFSPRWWLLQEPIPGSLQWSRGLGYLSQCEHPLRADVEPALRWRLLPPVIAHTLGLRDYYALILPWLGIVALLSACTFWGEAWLGRRTNALAFTLIIASTPAALVPLGWLGVNDAWFWLGLLAVCLARSHWLVIAAIVLCPWIDERFIIGLPLALIARRQIQPASLTPKFLLIGLSCLAPYLVIRTMGIFNHEDVSSHGFLSNTLVTAPTWLPYAPLGWWMALRAAWFFVIISGRTAVKDSRGKIWTLTLLGTLAVTAILAADLSRSAAILISLVAAGVVIHDRAAPETASSHLFVIAALNLLIPAAHIVYTSVDLINPLPVELYRILR